MATEELFCSIPLGWEYKTLGAACAEGGGDIQTGPFGSQLHAADYVPIGIPSIMPQNIGDNRLNEDGIARITPEDAQRLSRYLVRKGDIVYSRRGDVERRALVRAHEDGWLCGTGCLRVRLGDKGADPRYVSHYLGHPSVREWIVRHAHGATMPNLNTSILGACPFLQPPAKEQRAIADILSTLDDKIELNHQTNVTLEAMARALYKAWFVDFEPVRAKMEGRWKRGESLPGLPARLYNLFPERLIESELGEIPEGWQTLPVYSLATYVNGATLKAFQPNTERRGLPIIKIAELKAGVTTQTKFSDVTMPEKYRLRTGDILFSWSGNPDTSIDTFIWAHGDAWLNQHIFRVDVHHPMDHAFVLATLKYLRPVFAEIARNKQTTGLGHVTVGDMQRLLVVKPDEQILAEWDRAAAPIFAAAFCNESESISVGWLRDTLLPKLISGELRVRDTERIVGAAI